MSTKSDDAKWAHDRVEMSKHRETSSTFHVHKPRPLGHDLPKVALEGHLLHHAFLGTFFLAFERSSYTHHPRFCKQAIRLK